MLEVYEWGVAVVLIVGTLVSVGLPNVESNAKAMIVVAVALGWPLIPVFAVAWVRQWMDENEPPGYPHNLDMREVYRARRD